MMRHGIERLPDVINEHHAWPKYLGGPDAGPLISIDERLHQLLHAGLDQLLPRSKGSAYYAALSEAEKAKNIEILKAIARDFDIENGTKISEILAKALRGTIYE
jgi:hypothetical protein